MTDNEKQLIAALKSILNMPVKGHALQDRLQFSTAGREIMDQALDAIAACHHQGEELCGYCGGTGEGQSEGANCWHCKGRGMEP